MALTVELNSAPALRQELGPARLLPGPRGEAATVAVGSVASGESAAVTNSGDEHDAVFDFVLPQGGPGPGLEFDWQGTELGVRVAGEAEYAYSDLRGPAGPAAGVIAVTLAADGWEGGQQEAENAAFLAAGRAYLVSPAPESVEAYAAAGVKALDVTVDGVMTFVCTAAPAEALSVSVIALEVA
ncbi:MAG TPA: hypothetical protein IAC81_05735 [Candidatus Scatomorpha stercorigallinarum]|nr:hypothetical protein [Candidatus Scatomorpha stercorigallinarum]